MNPVLKQSLEDFLKKDLEFQRNYLGTILYPLVLERAGNDLAPKITGMLIDFENFSVADILELIDSPTGLADAIQEATAIIIKSMEQNPEEQEEDV